MSTTYTPTATYRPTLTVPSELDPATAASVNTAGLKFLADSGLYLKNRDDARWTWRVLAPYDLDTSVNPRSDAAAGVNVVDAVSLTGDRTYVIDDAGCANGDWLLVRNHTSNYVTVQDPSAVTLAVLGGPTAFSGSYLNDDWMLFVRSGGVWLPFCGKAHNAEFATSTLAVSGNSVLADVFCSSVAAGGNVSGALFQNGLSALGFQSAALFDVDQSVARNTVYYGVSLPSSDCTWTVQSSGEQNGDWVFASRGTIANLVAIATSSGVVVTLSASVTWAFLVRIVGAWRLVAYGA